MYTGVMKFEMKIRGIIFWLVSIVKDLVLNHKLIKNFYKSMREALPGGYLSIVPLK